MASRRTRSARARVSYNVDPYKDLDTDVETPRVGSDSEDEEFNPEEHAAEVHGGDEVDDEGEEEEEEYEDNDDGEAGSSGDAQSGQQSEEDREENEDADEENGEGGDGPGGSRGVGSSKGRRRRRAPARSLRRPGLTAKSNSKRERIESIYGSDVNSLLGGIKVRDLWIMDAVIPSRKNLSYSPFFPEGVSGIVELGEGEQVSRWLDYGMEKERLEGCLPNEDANIKCILGPLGGQKAITFTRFGICDLSTLYEERKGFMLNAGGHVSGMGWTPNRPKGFQYLAISIKATQPVAELERNSEIPPAYRRIIGPSHIQIWRVPPDSEKGTIGGKPSLAMIICHDWGTIKSLRWCPIPRKINDEKELGHLACVGGDGVVRVIRVPVPHTDSEEETVFVKIDKPLFEGRLQEALCTCVTWTSTHEIAAGCSNGFAVVWDLRHAISHGNNIGGNVFPPHHYLMLHQTYIMDIQSCYPSYPKTIITSSMDGYCRATSLHDPQADTILTGRSRLSSPAVVWADCIHTVLASEDGGWVKMYPLRRLWTSTSVARQSQGGVVLNLAGSKCHPFVLSCGGDGEVVLFNPLRKTFYGKIKVYQQTWFHLEYSPKSDMYRITEGFRIEKISFKFETKGAKGDALSTVFEEKSGVTQVCWNENPEFGGWAAAGCAGGLVRVEDLAD